MVDRISNYRELRLVVGIGPRHHTCSVFTRSVVNGRQNDRMVARAIQIEPFSIEGLSDIVDAFEAALAKIRDNEYTPPR